MSDYLLLTGRQGFAGEIRAAAEDLGRSLRRVDLVTSLAWHDIVSRYRGSMLGPFWITLSMAAMVVGIGVVYAQLFGLTLAEYIPFLALGIVIWGMIATTLVEGCDTFLQAAGMMRQTALPALIFPWRTVLRNLINLAHHVIIIAVVLALYVPLAGIHPLPALLGLALVVANLAWLSTIIAIVSARFRDVPQIIAATVQFAMFMTPVFWKPETIAARHVVLTWNPFHYMLAAVRDPLIGRAPPAHTYGILAIMALAGFLVAFAVFAVTRRRIVHYL